MATAAGHIDTQISVLRELTGPSRRLGSNAHTEPVIPRTTTCEPLSGTREDADCTRLTEQRSFSSKFWSVAKHSLPSANPPFPLQPFLPLPHIPSAPSFRIRLITLLPLLFSHSPSKLFPFPFPVFSPSFLLSNFLSFSTILLSFPSNSPFLFSPILPSFSFTPLSVLAGFH